MYVTLLMVVVLFACAAMLLAEGLWSNAIRLINVVTAALLAFNFFEPLAGWMAEQMPSYSYACDFVALWGIFSVASIVLLAITGAASKVKVKFLKPVDQAGSALAAVWIGWVMVGFTLATLHTAPLARTFLDGGFKAEEKMLYGMSPDRQWLAFVQSASKGVYAQSAPEASPEKYIFDPKAKFMPTYASRRTVLESNIKKGYGE